MNPNHKRTGVRPYQGQRLSLLTQHGKERVIGPALQEACGCEVLHTRGFDTDVLGTFTRDVSRAGTQIEAARRKARIGMELTGLKVGIASEGSFSLDPYTGIFAWNLELVVLLDAVRNLELHGSYSGPAQSESTEATCWMDVLRFTERARFPAHQLVIRPEAQQNGAAGEFRKGLATLDALREAFDWAMSRSQTKSVFLENDLRAHANPTRMANIQKAVINLAGKMNSPCPACDTPGYWLRELKKGRRCSGCGQPTRETLAEIWSCQRCGHTAEKGVAVGGLADPARCDFCNP